jgi:hypothetical protein
MGYPYESGRQRFHRPERVDAQTTAGIGAGGNVTLGVTRVELMRTAVPG